MTATKRPARARTAKTRPAASADDAVQEAIIQQVAVQLINAIIAVAGMKAADRDGVIADLRRQLSDVQMEAAEIAAGINSRPPRGDGS